MTPRQRRKARIRGLRQLVREATKATPVLHIRTPGGKLIFLGKIQSLKINPPNALDVVSMADLYLERLRKEVDRARPGQNRAR